MTYVCISNNSSRIYPFPPPHARVCHAPHEPAKEVESHFRRVGGEAAHPNGPAHLADGVLREQEHLDGWDEGGASLHLLKYRIRNNTI